jgi:hypothetical protein
MFASLYHGGMWSPEYRIFGRLGKIKFQPRYGLSVETMSENAREIFDNLVASHGYEPYGDE